MNNFFDLKKVVDPYRHMPNDIKNALFEGMRIREVNNDTIIHWIVGE